MRVSDILTDLINSSWLNFVDAILDSEYGYILSFNPVRLNIIKDSGDSAYISVTGDTLPNISFSKYGTVNYAPFIYLLNDVIEHPLYIPPNIQIWLPNPSKIYTILRDMSLSN